MIEQRQRPNALRPRDMLDLSTRVERLLRESRCRVDRSTTLIQASQESLRSLGPPPSGEDARDRPKHRSVSFHGNLWEDDEAGEKMDADTKPFLNLKFSKEDVGLPTSTLPPPTDPLRGVEQNTMQRPISMSV